MNNEKICPVYSASDNTARKCIKEECGWWCDQRNACAVVSTQELLNIISKTLCKDKEDILKSAQAENEAEW